MIDNNRPPSGQTPQLPSSETAHVQRNVTTDQKLVDPSTAFTGWNSKPSNLRELFHEAAQAWLAKSPSMQTRTTYRRDLGQFLAFAGIDASQLDRLASVTPRVVAAWRDALRQRGLTNSSIRRKLTVLRSLYSYLKRYGYAGANPAHSDFVAAPPVPRDGKTACLSPEDCRRLLLAPDTTTPAGVRDAAMLTVLAYSACRVGELVRLRVGDYHTNGGHKVLELFGKGGKERRVPLHPEAFEQLDEWLAHSGLAGNLDAPLFPPTATARGKGRDGFARRPLSIRAVEQLVRRYALDCGLGSSIVVHSFRVTALTTARERGADIIDLQDFAGHSDPRTTLAYIRNRDRLSKSPAYVLRY